MKWLRSPVREECVGPKVQTPVVARAVVEIAAVAVRGRCAGFGASSLYSRFTLGISSTGLSISCIVLSST